MEMNGTLFIFYTIPLHAQTQVTVNTHCPQLATSISLLSPMFYLLNTRVRAKGPYLLFTTIFLGAD